MIDLLTTLGLKKHPIEKQDDPEDDVKLSTENLYKHRWVWYHLILCLQMIITNFLLIAIIIILATKL